MRVTVSIDDDVLVIAREYAEKHGVTLGTAISDLVRRGSEPLPYFELKNGFAQLKYRGKKPLTPELVSELLEDDA